MLHWFHFLCQPLQSAWVQSLLPLYRLIEGGHLVYILWVSCHALFCHQDKSGRLSDRHIVHEGTAWVYFPILSAKLLLLGWFVSCLDKAFVCASGQITKQTTPFWHVSIQICRSAYLHPIVWPWESSLKRFLTYILCLDYLLNRLVDWAFRLNQPHWMWFLLLP